MNTKEQTHRAKICNVIN